MIPSADPCVTLHRREGVASIEISAIKVADVRRWQEADVRQWKKADLTRWTLTVRPGAPSSLNRLHGRVFATPSDSCREVERVVNLHALREQ